MRSVYIITGGILVMIAVVFLAHNQKHTDEKASSTLDEIDAHILKEFGPDLSPKEIETIRQEITEHLLALEKAEMRKYGRVLTDEERSEQWWREQDEAEKQAAYAKLYEERKEWIDNFPFQPRYHQDILYDPENNIAHSTEKFHAYKKELEKKSTERWLEITDKEAREIWARTDLTTEEKHAEDERLWRAVEQADEAIQNPDPEIMAERRIIMRHKRLDGFYKQHYRYRPEFEQAYRIFEEEGAGDNPLRIANTMLALEGYFVTKRQANQHGLDELHPFQTRWEEPQAQSSNPQKKTFIGTRQEYAEFIRSRKPQRRRITWKEELESEYSCIAGNMMSQRNLLLGEENISREQAYRIRDRLIAEIPADGFTGNTFWVGMADPKDEDMVPGQSLLVE